jgi:pimeloyl-ACP methyl ester carboxylesterase
MRAITLAFASVFAAATPAAADYIVKEVGSFHVGGRTETLSGLPTKEIVFSPGAPPIKVDPNGEFEVEQMYVQYVRLTQPKGRVPLLLWHGGGLSGVTWETKPDGNPGWQQFFLNAGYDTYVSDAVERGRASWARYPEIFKGEPFFRAKKEAWELFRIGPTYEVGGKREAFEGQQFPIEAFDQFGKQCVPRWVTNDAATQKAYDALVQQVCPCVIVVHSQGGNFGFTAALNAPDKVKALIAIEPSAHRTPAKVEAAKVKGRAAPHRVGRFHRQACGVGRVSPPIRSSGRRRSRAPAATAETFDLPKMGIKGNTHMLMMDRNSDEIAKLVGAWIEKQGLVN